MYVTDIEEGHRVLLRIKGKWHWNIICCHPLFWNHCRFYPILFARYWYFNFIVSRRLFTPLKAFTKALVLKLGQLWEKKNTFSSLKVKRMAVPHHHNWAGITEQRKDSIYSRLSFPNNPCSPLCLGKTFFRLYLRYWIWFHSGSRDVKCMCIQNSKGIIIQMQWTIN